MTKGKLLTSLQPEISPKTDEDRPESVSTSPSGDNVEIRAHVFVSRLLRSSASLPTLLFVLLIPAHQVPEHYRGYPRSHKNLRLSDQVRGRKHG